MKRKTHIKSIFTLVLIAYSLLSVACLKQAAYAKPIEHLSSDTIVSIKAMRKWHTNGSVEAIKNAFAIEGVIVANDEHDNVYKSIFIQDSTGGIMLLMDGTSLYQNYPVGTLVRVRIQNLFLTDYRRMLQLVASIDTSAGMLVSSGIPVPLFPKFITALKDNYPVVPLLVSAKNLGDSLQGRLIRISNVEFSATDTLQTYADKKNKTGASRSVKFCVGGTIYLRTSGYADFAGVKIPTGNGDIVGVYSVYNYEKQILIRDTSDILLNGRRCTGAAWLQKTQ
ncbi:MAG: DUF5689 domain-containing protein [Sediminibacterium sp.]